MHAARRLIRPLLDRLKALILGLQRDPATGHLYYPVDGIRHFVRFPAELLRSAVRRHYFEQVYFRHYRPSGRDCVVDFGAGLGTEIIPLGRSAPELRYIAVEIQPWIYECLCLTLAQLPKGFLPFGMAVGDEHVVGITPTRAGEDGSILGDGPVPVPMVSWAVFAHRMGIETVDLLKMNVEGAEADLLEHIDLRQVRRVVVSVHDFRADRGENEAFRTRARVEGRLRSAGFRLFPVNANWIFADRE
jgi:FkbM family methyltransferase